MVRRIFLLAAVLLFALALSPKIEASGGLIPYESENIDYEAEYKAFTEAIPEDIASVLPEGVFSGSEDARLKASETVIAPAYFFEVILDMLGFHIKDALHMLARLIGIIILSALANAALKNFSGERIREAFSFCSLSAVLIIVMGEQFGLIRAVDNFLSRLVGLVNAMIPLMGVLYAFAGNVTTAAVSGSSLAFFIAICQNLFSATLMPAVGISLSFSAVSAFSGKSGTQRISSFFKNLYTYGLGLLMSVFALVMSTQNELAAKADSLGARAAKFAVGSFIPIAGGAVGDSLRTVAASAEYIKSSVGGLGIAVIILLVLPLIISLILTRLSLSLSAAVAGMLGCEKEERLLSEVGGACGYMLAVCALCSVLFIYALTLFIRCNSAFYF